MQVLLGSCSAWEMWKPRCQASAVMDVGRGAVDLTNSTVSVAMDGVRGAGGTGMDVFRSARDLFVTTAGGIVNSTVTKPLSNLFSDGGGGSGAGTGVLNKNIEVGGVAYPALPLYIGVGGLLLIGVVALSRKKSKRRRK